jgi:hypothetical protein
MAAAMRLNSEQGIEPIDRRDGAKPTVLALYL